MKTTSICLSLGIAAALVAACGGSTAPADAPAAEPPAEESSAEEAPAEEAETGAVSFDDMTPPQKMKLMKEVVAPGMAKVFHELDAEEFKDFSCATCHGPGAKSGDFEMPSAALPLNAHEMEEHPDVTKFMKERVVPAMAKMLGEEPYNPETNSGFEIGRASCRERV